MVDKKTVTFLYDYLYLHFKNQQCNKFHFLNIANKSVGTKQSVGNNKNNLKIKQHGIPVGYKYDQYTHLLAVKMRFSLVAMAFICDV